MNTIRWDTVPEATREFIRSAAHSPEGAVFEEDGKPVFRLIAYPPPATVTADPAWTADDNARRCALIDKDIDGQLAPDERVELDALEQRLERYVDAVAPLPLVPLRKLYQEVLDNAARANGAVPLMTSPFVYPASPHVRRHGPMGYADHASFRPWLRDEFAFRCVYCLRRETMGQEFGAREALVLANPDARSAAGVPRPPDLVTRRPRGRGAPMLFRRSTLTGGFARGDA